MPLADIAIANAGASAGTLFEWFYATTVPIRKLLSGIVPTWTTESAPGGAVTVPSDGTDLKAWFDITTRDANGRPAGTKFWFTPGTTYRLTTWGFAEGDWGIIAMDGDGFYSDPANPAILNGSIDIDGSTGWALVSGRYEKTYNYAEVTVEGTGSPNLCALGGTTCAKADDVYINNVAQLRVAAVGDVGVGDYYIDYGANKIYIGENPSGKLIEVSHVRTAIAGHSGDLNASGASAGDNVTVRGLKVTQFAGTSQHGAIATGLSGKAWTIQYCHVYRNHACGISFGNGCLIENNRLEFNGHAGLKFVNPVVGAIPSPSGATLRYNRIVDNHPFAMGLGYKSGWEGGGTKFGRGANMVIEYNYTARNQGSALWLDVANYNAAVRYNVCHGDYDNGSIHDEGSYDSELSYNICLFGGYDDTDTDANNWPFAAGIKISTSNRTNCHHNVVVKCRSGIGVLDQERDDDGTGDPDINYNRELGGTDLVDCQDPPGTPNPIKEVHKIVGVLVEDNLVVMLDDGAKTQYSSTVKDGTLIEHTSTAFSGGVKWRRNTFYVDTAIQRFKFNGNQYTGALWQSGFSAHVSDNTFTAIGSWSDARLPVGLTS